MAKKTNYSFEKRQKELAKKKKKDEKKLRKQGKPDDDENVAEAGHNPSGNDGGPNTAATINAE